MKKLLILIGLTLPYLVFSASPACFSGIEVSLVDANNKVVKTGKFDSRGKLTLSGVGEATYDIKLTSNGKSIMLSSNNKGKIKRLDKSTPLLMKVSLSDYQDGDDLLLRKRPGRTHIKDTGSGMSTGKRGMSQDYNSTRPNRSTSDALDPDSDDDGLSDSCKDAEITVTSKGKDQIEIHITVLK